jgi:Zn-dependent oligopeptidase
MEHWLSEKSTIYALTDVSKSDRIISDIEIDAAFRVRSKEKAIQLTHSAFLNELELQLLTTFNVRGNESMIALQQRLAKELIPRFDQPTQDDITPLLEIFQENAAGRHSSMYRYLWCDCLSALVFNRMKEQYTQSSQDSDTNYGIIQLRRRLRKYLLEPGAAIDIEEFFHQFQMSEDVSPDALFERYGMAQWVVVDQPQDVLKID